MKNHFISVPLRYYFKNKSELFWIFTLLLLKKLPIFSPMPLSCRCSHHIPTRITNFKFSRIFSKTESFGKTNQTKIHNLFFMKRCGDQQNLQKICNPCPAIVRLSLNFTPDNLFIREWILNFEFWKNKSNENSYFIFNERCGDQLNLQKKIIAIPALLLFTNLWIPPRQFVHSGVTHCYFFWAFSLEIFCVVRTFYNFITMHDVI